MKRKTLLVLGASLYQLKAIQIARSLGYRVVVADNVSENPGHQIADVSYVVSTTDRAGILEVALREGVNGVLAPATDVAVPTAVYVSEMLNLPGPPMNGAEIASDKIKFREFLVDHGLPVPDFVPIVDGVEPSASWFERDRVILKPSQSSGSKGVFVVRSRDEFRCCLPETIGFSLSGQAILEEFVDGHQGTLEGVLERGEVKLRFFTDRETHGAPYVTTTGHLVPSTLPGYLQQRAEEQVREAWQLLGVRFGPFDCDFVATEQEVYLLEMAPRLGGNSIAELLEYSADFDITSYAVRTACGDAVKLTACNSPKSMGVLILGVREEGALWYDVSQAEELRRAPWVIALNFDVAKGEPVKPFVNGRHRVGEALIQAANRDELDGNVRILRDRLALRAS